MLLALLLAAHCSAIPVQGVDALSGIGETVTTSTNGSVTTTVWAEPKRAWMGTCPDPAEIFRAIRADVRARKFLPGGNELVLSAGRAETGKTVLYDLAALAAESAKHTGAGRDSWSYRPLSLVGPLFSVRELHEGEPVGGTPGSSERWRTWDLRTGKPADVLELVDEASLVSALKKDSYLRDAGIELSSASTLDAVGEALGGQRMETDLHSGFAVVGWDAAHDRLTLRIALVEEQGYPNVTTVAPLGLIVTPRAGFRAALTDAAGGNGFFLGSKTARP